MTTMREAAQEYFVLSSTCKNVLEHITNLMDRVPYQSSEWYSLLDFKKAAKMALDNSHSFHGNNYDNMLHNVYEYYSNAYKIVFDYEYKEDK